MALAEDFFLKALKRQVSKDVFVVVQCPGVLHLVKLQRNEKLTINIITSMLHIDLPSLKSSFYKCYKAFQKQEAHPADIFSHDNATVAAILTPLSIKISSHDQTHFLILESDRDIYTFLHLFDMGILASIYEDKLTKHMLSKGAIFLFNLLDADTADTVFAQIKEGDDPQNCLAEIAQLVASESSVHYLKTSAFLYLDILQALFYSHCVISSRT